MASAFALARVEEGGKVKVGHEFWMGTDYNELNPRELAEKAVREALSYLGASSAKTGSYPVIFRNDAANDLFSTFSGIFFAERVQKGFSLLKGKLGEKIAADIVTIRDDGVCPLNIGSVPFDSEGVAVKNKALVENGVLKTFLYNLKTAETDGVSSTGNGFNKDTACTNFYLEPSKLSVDELAAKVGNGIFITQLAGLHSGTNTISGDFSCSADGFMIENGKVTTPVEQITVAGNFFQLLKDIEGVGSDLRFTSTAPGAYGMPSVLVKELKISGE
jgi:PmbA protein